MLECKVMVLRKTSPQQQQRQDSSRHLKRPLELTMPVPAELNVPWARMSKKPSNRSVSESQCDITLVLLDQLMASGRKCTTCLSMTHVHEVRKSGSGIDDRSSHQDALLMYPFETSTFILICVSASASGT